MTVTVLKAGLLSSLQDGGRPGHAASGLGRAGAMDRPAWRLANALVGNSGDEAAIECTLLGPTLRFEHAATIALTGAELSARVGERNLPLWTRCRLPAGSVLQLGGMRIGCRSYLAIGGGFDAPVLLGSRSSDLHAHVGRALQAGDELPTGVADPQRDLFRDDAVSALHWGIDPQPWFDFAGQPLDLLPGSHLDALDDDSRQNLFGAGFVVSRDGNRTATRLDGRTLSLKAPLELISEPALPGTMQLPPSGQPIVLMAEAPVTGGYPRIGQLAAVDLPRLAQRRPGDSVRFRECTLETAVARLLTQRQALEAMLATIAQRLEHPDQLSPFGSPLEPTGATATNDPHRPQL